MPLDYDRYRLVVPGPVDLSGWDPSDKSLAPGTKDDRKQILAEHTQQLADLQELLYAEGKHRVLIVLQGPDTAGKDGTIRHVFDGVNPQGVDVISFKRPTHLELERDYLRRYHIHAPRTGGITIFNRSQYEEVLAVRVREIAPREVWERRYDHINAFERMLADEGVTILKFFLHISKDEQRERLIARRDTPHKQWKLTHADVEDRKLWASYEQAYADMLERTSTKWAPWYVVPANSKSYRNVVVSGVIIEHLEALGMRYPDPEPGIESLVID